MKTFFKYCLLPVTFLLGASSAVMGQAIDFPTQPVRIVVPYPAGGLADITARLLAEHLPGKLGGQTVVVENRPGANGTIGAMLVARAKPDGHTLGLVVSSHAFSRALMPRLRFNPVDDFEAITQVTATSIVMVASAELPVSTFAQFMEYARNSKEQIVFASAGSGSNVHVFGQWFSDMAKLGMLHVPYKGSSEAHADLIAGRTHITFDTLGAVLPHIRSGKLKLLAAAGPKRLSQFPNVPTIAESGFPDFSADSWAALLAPKGTPAALIAKLQEAVAEVLARDDVRERLEGAGAKAVGSTPEQAKQLLRRDEQHYGDLVKKMGIQLN